MYQRFYKLRYYLLLLVLPIVGLLFSPMVESLRVDNSLSVWFKENDPVLETYEQFQSTFGSDEVVVIIYKPTDETLSSSIQRLNNLTLKMEQMEEVNLVSSINTIQVPERFGLALSQNSIVDVHYTDEQNLGRIQQYESLSKYFYHPQNGSFRILVQLQNVPDIDEKRGEIIHNIKDLTLSELPTTQVAFGGVGVIFEGLNEFSQQQFGMFLGLCYLFILIAMTLYYRRIKVILYALAVILSSTIITLGLYGYFDHRLNLMTTFIPTIIVLLGILDVIHVLNHHDTQDKHNTKSALQSAWKPCLYTSLTTMAGFLALCFAPIEVLREFGLFAAIGIGLCYLFTLLFGLLFLPHIQRKSSPKGWSLRIIRSIGNNQKAWRGVAFTLLLVFLAGMYRLHVDTYTLGYFPVDHEIRDHHRNIENWWGHYMPLELIIESKNGSDLYEKDNLKKMEAFTDTLCKSADISEAFGYHSIFNIAKDIRYGKDKNNLSQPAINKLVRTIQQENLGFYNQYTKSNTGRVTLFGRMATAGELKSKMDEIESLAIEHFKEDIKVVPAGYLPMYAKIINYISYSQLNSLVAAIVFIFLLVLIYLRDIRLALISVVTNLFPLVILFGTVGWLGISIDLATASIAAIALSFCIDDTMHVLYQFQKERLQNTPKKALDNTMHKVGHAVIISSLLLFFGYGMMLLSPLKTVKLFGGLTAITVFGALLSQFVIFPFLLKLLYKKTFSDKEP